MVKSEKTILKADMIFGDFTARKHKPSTFIIEIYKGGFIMKKISLLSVFFLFFLSLAPMGVHAVSVSASSAVLTDAKSGEFLFEKNSSSPLPMASTTKIMTAICAIENCNTNIPIIIDERAVGIEGSSIYLKNGERMTVKELLYGLMLNSGNDAAAAIAIAVSGSEEDFAVLMNDTAKRLGALNTNFTNPSGLYDDAHFTTARDLAKITAYAMQNPLFRHIVGTKTQKISAPEGSRYLKNHNRLLRELEGCTGVKTGYTKRCGRCLVSARVQGDREYIAVTLNAPDDWRDHRAMYESIGIH